MAHVMYSIINSSERVYTETSQATEMNDSYQLEKENPWGFSCLLRFLTSHYLKAYSRLAIADRLATMSNSKPSQT